jgi:hypothetical protein
LIGHLYRYPHPHDSTQFVYVGQGMKRDVYHRKGNDGFGRRFKKRFPGVELPRPIREEIEVRNQLELNEIETIWMFQYHTWRGYEGGMNLTFPGSDDYKNLGRLSFELRTGIHAPEMYGVGGRIGGKIGGRKTASIPGHMARAGHISGRMNVENGHILALGLWSIESGHLRNLQLQNIGSKRTDEQRANISTSLKGANNPGWGKKLSTEHLAKISKANKGRVLSLETRAKMSAACKGRNISIACRKKLSAALKGITSHNRWHVKDSLSRHGTLVKAKPSPRCASCSEQSLVIAFA